MGLHCWSLQAEQGRAAQGAAGQGNRHAQPGASLLQSFPCGLHGTPLQHVVPSAGAAFWPAQDPSCGRHALAQRSSLISHWPPCRPRHSHFLILSSATAGSAAIWGPSAHQLLHFFPCAAVGVKLNLSRRDLVHIHHTVPAAQNSAEAFLAFFCLGHSSCVHPSMACGWTLSETTASACLICHSR